MSSFFEHAASGTIKVPDDYIHEYQIQRFISQQESNILMNIDPEVGQGVFKYPTHRLVAGKNYLIETYRINTTSIEACIYFLESKKSLFVGPQGLSLIYDKYKNQGGPRPIINIFTNLIAVDIKEKLPETIFGKTKICGIYEGNGYSLRARKYKNLSSNPWRTLEGNYLFTIVPNN